MTIYESLREKSFYFIFSIYFVLMIFFGSTNDWDGLLDSSGNNFYSFLVINLHLPGNVLLFFNVFIFSYFQFLVFKVNKFLFFVVLVNPLFFLNVVDAYNKFVFVIFVYFVLFGFFCRSMWGVYVNFLFMLLINPIYSFFSIAIVRFLSKRFLVSTASVVFFLLLCVFYDYQYLKEVVLLNEKVILLVEQGMQSLNFSEGSFGIADEYLGLSFRSIYLRFLGAFFPYFFINSPGFTAFCFSFLNLVLFVSLLYFVKFRFSLYFIICLFLFTAIMTNYTRAFRHLYVFFMILVLLNYYPFFSIFKRRN